MHNHTNLLPIMHHMLCCCDPNNFFHRRHSCTFTHMRKQFGQTTVHFTQVCCTTASWMAYQLVLIQVYGCVSVCMHTFTCVYNGGLRMHRPVKCCNLSTLSKLTWRREEHPAKRGEECSRIFCTHKNRDCVCSMFKKKKKKKSTERGLSSADDLCICLHRHSVVVWQVLWKGQIGRCWFGGRKPLHTAKQYIYELC